MYLLKNVVLVAQNNIIAIEINSYKKNKTPGLMT